MDLLSADAWIFDMDGTLTLAAHDFAAFKRGHGLPLDRPILEALADLPPAEARILHERLAAWEEDVASRAAAAPDALPLLRALHARGRRLGVLTRNSRRVADLTLQAAGLASFFADDAILGRDDAAPKPAPDGVRLLLERWGVPPDRAVMVGDYRFDREAGRAAGAATVLVDRDGEDPPWRDLADVVVARLDDLLTRPG